MPFLQGVRGQAVCVLGSGGTKIAFALAGLGGRVSSVDVSEQRPRLRENERALGLDVDFLQSDGANLCDHHDDAFDLVYTGGHVSVWVSDLRKFIAEAVRILRPGEALLISEYDPVRWLSSETEDRELRRRCLDQGPYRCATEQGPPTFEHPWGTPPPSRR